MAPLKRSQLVEDALEVNQVLTNLILGSLDPWQREEAVALLLQNCLWKAPANLIICRFNRFIWVRPCFVIMFQGFVSRLVLPKRHMLEMVLGAGGF